MLILRDHYTDEMEAKINILNTLSTYHWQNPLDVASSWARRNLGRRLQEETLEQAAALLTAQIVDRTVAAPAQPEQSTPVPHTSSTKTVNTTTTMTDPKGDSIVEVETEYRIPPSMVLTSPVPKPQRTRRIPSLTPRGKRVPSLTPQPPARSPPPPFNPAVATEEDSIFDLSLEELEYALVPATLPQQPSCPVLSRSPVATRSLGAQSRANCK
ncbi:HHIP-like protein 1 [Dissostichus eleginoides]|uniref:HHIP-like protein 1 n=1 Tax=Dissostichus eleginoides TaxID=100907 RepID=A0AAD9B097_DISEL|nr:HHIP-like protein 1 [Dissostichus eleginoides]